MSDQRPPVTPVTSPGTPRATIADRMVGQPATPPTPPAKNGQTVCVGCRLGNGVIIRALKPEEVSSPSPSGPVTSKVAVEVARHVLRGPNSTLQSGDPSGVYPGLVSSG